MGVTPGNFERAIQQLRVAARILPFADLGCGKGRALILAWEAGFRQVTGVEFSSSLVEVARYNLRDYPDIIVLHPDAVNYSFPAKYVVLFMYNPFDATVMSRMMESVRSQALEGYVIYLNPQHEKEIEEAGAVQLAKGSNFSLWEL